MSATVPATLPADFLAALQAHAAAELLPHGFAVGTVGVAGVREGEGAVAVTLYCHPRTDGARVVEVYACQDCGATYDTPGQLHRLVDVEARVLPGEVMPDGQCPDPECGAVCHRTHALVGGQPDA